MLQSTLNLFSTKNNINSVGIVFLIILSILSVCIMPLLQSIALIMVNTTIFLCLRYCYKHSFIYHKLGEWSLLVFAALLTAGIIFNIRYFTTASGGTLDNPILNNSDSCRICNIALRLYNGEPANDMYAIYSNIGFPYVISTIWHITGVTILVPLLINYSCTLLSILLSAFVTVKLLRRKIESCNYALAGALAMLMTGGCCYYLGCGTVILKEPSLFLGIVCTLLPIASLMNKKNSIYHFSFDILLFLIGALILIFNRIGFLYIIFTGILLSINKKNISRCTILGVICILSIFTGYIVTHNGFNHDAVIVSHDNSLNNEYFNIESESNAHNVYNKQIDGYADYSIAHKVLLLPLSAAVQYFIPFVWTAGSSAKYGPTQVYSHFGFIWYCVGGLVLFYLLYQFRYRPRTNLWRWGLFIMFSYLVPAYLFAGTVSRYWLPFLPAYSVIAAYVVIKLKEKQGRNLFIGWSCVYTIIVAGVLTSCYLLTN